MSQTIQEFIERFDNHPVLFIGSGISMRYLENSYSWEYLLKKICVDLVGDEKYFLDLKNEVYDLKHKEYDYAELGSLLEKEIDKKASDDKNNYRYEEINASFYKTMEQGIQTSRLKIYISDLLKEIDYKTGVNDEIQEFKKASKNFGSIITTNYDTFLENTLDFNPLIGNNILLSNPYGSVYKIHGSIEKPEDIIITKNDYKEFNEKYELIRAQLLSLFIHNPIIFLGYSISDDNIRKILETIFSYVDIETELFEAIRKNFLLVEYSEGSANNIVTDYDISIKNTDIRINKLKTDDYLSLYKGLSKLSLPISAMDVRRVSSVVSEIYKGGKKEDSVKVVIVEEPESLENSDKVLAIGSQRTISYVHKDSSTIIKEYFDIIENREYQIIEVIDSIPIQEIQYFPVFGFYEINPSVVKLNQLKEQQLEKIRDVKNRIEGRGDHYAIEYNSISEVINSNNAQSNIPYIIIWNIFEKNIPLDDFESFLKAIADKTNTNYRMYLCVYDYLRYKDE